jgi:hypothetical protein
VFSGREDHQVFPLQFVSTVALFDVPVSTLFDGLPASASRVL